MKKLLSPLFIVGAPIIALIAMAPMSYAGTALWTLDNVARKNSTQSTTNALTLDQGTLNAIIQHTPKENTTSQGFEIDIPLPTGEIITLALFEYEMMEQGLAEEFPNIKTYKARGVNDPSITGRFDITSSGIRGLVSKAGESYYYDPNDSNANTSDYQTYARSQYINKATNQPAFRCSATQSNALSTAERMTTSAVISISGSKLHTYRLAVSATGEYTAFHGGTTQLGQEAIVTAVNRINEVYARELAIQFTLIDNNSSLVYTNASTDPFTNDDGDALLTQNTDTINSVIGSDNYDIGHVFSTGGGGIAAFESTCSSQKAEGVTGHPSPTGDAFWVDFVAHEIGHQMGASHTFNGDQGSCFGNRESHSAYEPGSGSTIMSYAGICESDDIVQNSSDYFHAKSLEEVAAFADSFGSACGTHETQSNQNPTADAGESFTIPQQTPFELTASGTDGDDDTLTYNWEQYDLGNSSAPGIDNGSGPIFRSFSPSENPVRTLPLLSSLINNESPPTGSVLPSTNRTLNFRLTVRDGNGAVTSDDSQITVTTTSGPFAITSQSSNTSWSGGEQETVTWNVAGTTATPVSCSNVDILYSTDNGTTFGTTILSSTPNDGTQSITVPNQATSLGRIKVKCSDNIFFDINDGTITTSASANTAPVVDDFSFSVTAGGTNTSQITATDAEDDSLTFSIVTQPNQGSVSIEGDSYTYTANSDATGSDTFVIKANDGSNDSNNATATVNFVTLNSAPTVPDFSFSVNAGESKTDQISATDNEDDNLTFSIVTQPSKGTLSIEADNYTYTADSNASGTDTFVIKANDGENDSAEATATVSINTENNVPILNNASISVNTGESITEQFSATDPEDDDLIFSIVTQPTKGSLTIDGDSYTYTADDGTSGFDSFIVKANDGVNDSEHATFEVSINTTAEINTPEPDAQGNYLAEVSFASQSLISWLSSSEFVSTQGSPVNNVITNTITSSDMSMTFTDGSSILTTLSASGANDSCIEITTNGLAIEADSLTSTTEIKTEATAGTRIQLQAIDGCNLQASITDENNQPTTITQLPSIVGSSESKLVVSISESNNTYTVTIEGPIPSTGITF